MAKMSGDEMAIRRLIRKYTRERDWFMVERMFNDLGKTMIQFSKTA